MPEATHSHVGRARSARALGAAPAHDELPAAQRADAPAPGGARLVGPPGAAGDGPEAHAGGGVRHQLRGAHRGCGHSEGAPALASTLMS